ncbi:hypothetical protein RHGRI_033206 [Rhododendron griersonianum]|uniref:Jacalin-type lectin domain-containing protein n=1 Tax=Rhododendron griersonianum TaxID=479676 RepID=A0AAV6HWC9_9ERIC|nr:hypothetical protein RHGRI_033206 [Rhododendron griersonianum]
MEINWESLMYVVLAVGSEIWTARQPIVEDVVHRIFDALWGFASQGLRILWRLIAAPVLLDQGQAVVDLQKIEEELKTQIKGVEAENEVLKEKNGAMEKQVVDLQKMEEVLKTKVKEVEAENEMLSKRNEKVVHLQKREEELKEEIKELKTESKELKLESKEVKKEIKEVEAEKEVMRKRNEVSEKKVGDLLKIEEELKIEIKELKTELRELKKEIKEVEAKNEVLRNKNEVLRNRNEVMEKKVVDLQKIEEQLKTEKNNINEVAAKNEVLLKNYINDAVAKNEVLRKRNEELDKKVVDLQMTEEELKKKIEEVGAEDKVLRENNEAMEKKFFLLQVPLSGQCQGISDGQSLSLTFEAKLSFSFLQLCIDSSVEQLLSISLTYGDISGMRLITLLSFYSNRARYGPYGTGFGSTVSIPIEGSVLAGFHGRAGLYLDSFGVLVAPKVLSSSHKFVL